MRGQVLVPENDTHKQTITDVYNIFKSTYSKRYNTDDELFYSDVTHCLEQQSASTFSEVDSVTKYEVEDPSLKEALNAVPKWTSQLPKNYGINVDVSLTCKEDIKDSPLNHLENMGIEMIEYVKLRVGYTYLKSHFNKVSSVERSYTKEICPGLSGGVEDPIILRMIHMQYITRDDYLKWVQRSRKKEDVVKKDFREDTYESNSSLAEKKLTDDSSTVRTTSVSKISFDTGIENSNDKIFGSTRKSKEDIPQISADEKRVIMLTQYEVMDQELPDEIEIFWPGKRDYENDYANFKTALHANLLHQEFIQKYKSARLEGLSEEARKDAREYFAEIQPCMPATKDEKKPTPKPDEQKKKKASKCNYERLKEQFKDYKITQEYTLSLFQNVLKEKTRLEDLNLCCIISKLKDIHKQDPDNEGELIWKDVVVIKTKSKESIKTTDIIIDEVDLEEKKEVKIELEETKQVEFEPEGTEEVEIEFEEEDNEETEEEDDEEVEEEEVDEDEEFDDNMISELKTMIYITKVYPDHRNNETDQAISKKKKCFPCNEYTLKGYKEPSYPLCTNKISLPPKDKESISSKENTGESDEGQELFKTPSMQTIDPDEYVTFHTDWSNYPYTEMLDIIFHRYHKGYIYMTDVFEIKPNTLREINRIFHNTGKYSEAESRRTSINTYFCNDPQPRPECCETVSLASESQCLDISEFPTLLSPVFKSMGEDTLVFKRKTRNPTTTSSENEKSSVFEPGNVEYIRIQNLEIKKENDSNGLDHTSSSSELDTNDDDIENGLTERFISSQVSSVFFDKHEENENELQDNYTVNIDYREIYESKAQSPDDDDYSEIVDFIKNFRFNEEKFNRMKYYEGFRETKPEREKGVFVDILSSKSCHSMKELNEIIKEHDERSVNTNDTLSLSDFKGFIGKKKNCHPEERLNHSNSTMSQKSQNSSTLAPRLQHCVSGELYDILIEKRKSIIQELRTSFPLIYIYLSLESELPKTNISGKLEHNKFHLENINEEFNRIKQHFKMKSDHKPKNIFSSNVDNHSMIYEEIFGKNVILADEMLSMVIYYPFVRHIFVREVFQDIGINLSFFLLHFIENDNANIYYQQKPEAIKTMQKEVSKFLCDLRQQIDYLKFVKDMVLVHYFETKRFFTITNIIDRDCDWEKLFTIPREITDWTSSEKIQINTNYKDAIYQDPSGYSYLFHCFLQQFNNNYYLNDLFKQFLEPELHPKLLKDMTCDELDHIIEANCIEWCDIDLISELEKDIKHIMRTIWESEILGLNRCSIKIFQITNRFWNETGFYLRDFFPNNIIVQKTQPYLSENSPAVEPDDIWTYNRKLDFWFNVANGKTIRCINNNFLLKDNLFKFETLLTRCLLRSILTFYEFRIHG